MIHVLVQSDSVCILLAAIKHSKEEEALDSPVFEDLKSAALSILAQLFVLLQTHGKCDDYPDMWKSMLEEDVVLNKIRQIGMARIVKVDDDGNILLRLS